MAGGLVTDNLIRNAHLVDALGSSLRRGDHALGTVPALLKQILEKDAWREFETSRGERVRHERFADFVTTPPLKGLGADVDLIDRIVGTADPDLLRLLRDAKKGKPGRPLKGLDPLGELKGINGEESTPISKGEDTALTAQRLAAQAPEEYEAVKRGDRTIHAAAVRAGFRRRRIPVRLDSPESAAQTLRKHMSADALARLARLLTEDD